MRKYDFKQLFEGTREILRRGFLCNLKATDISSADSSFQHEKMISEVLAEYRYPQTLHFCHYHFTGSFRQSTIRQIKKKLGAELSSGVALLSSATLSLNTSFVFLQKRKVKKMAIISPHYFISSDICHALGIRYSIIPAKKRSDIPFIPVETIMQGGFDAVLITSPLYGTSKYYSDDIVDDIKLLQSEKKYIVFDETMAIKGHELLRTTALNDYSLFIFSPHKSLGINSFKFSAIISSKNNESALRECVETYAGGLNQTSVLAIGHYLSSNFNRCQELHLKTVKNNYKTLIDSLPLWERQFVSFDGLGHYASVLPGSDFPGNTSYFSALESSIAEHRIAFMPPWPLWDNGFRINMTYPQNELAKAINCIVRNFGIKR